MHELSIVQHFVDLAVKYAKEAGETDVAFVTLEVGEMTGVVPRYVQMYYPDVTRKTLLENSELRIEFVKAEAFCKDCGETYHYPPEGACCPQCGSAKREIIAGNKLILKELGFRS